MGVGFINIHEGVGPPSRWGSWEDSKIFSRLGGSWEAGPQRWSGSEPDLLSSRPENLEAIFFFKNIKRLEDGGAERLNPIFL